MLATLVFDVEDLITTQSDDAAKWIAAEVERAGIVATFFLVGEKVRLLRERGREDVLEHLKAHEIGFHSTTHSVHPVVCEVCAPLSFLDGVRTLMEREREGWEETEAILGTRLVGWATTGGSWTPSLCGMMHQYGGVQVYSPVCFGEHSVVWFGNCLNFGHFIGGLDGDYADDERYARALERFEKQTETIYASTRDWIGIFGGHPTRVISHEFWDGVNFAAGANPPRSEWRAQRLRSAEEIETAQRNVADFVRRLRDDARFELHPLSEVARRFRAQSPGCSGTELLRIAERVCDEGRPLFTEAFSAAELAVMFAHALALGETEGAWFVRPTVFGPDTTPPDVRPLRLSSDALRATATQITASLAETGCLPPFVEAGGRVLSLGQAFVGYARLLRRPDALAVEVPAVAPYPTLADDLAAQVREHIRGWTIHPSAAGPFILPLWTSRASKRRPASRRGRSNPHGSATGSHGNRVGRSRTSQLRKDHVGAAPSSVPRRSPLFVNEDPLRC